MGFWANTPEIVWLWGWSLESDAYNGAFLRCVIIQEASIETPTHYNFGSCTGGWVSAVCVSAGDGAVACGVCAQ